MSNNPVVLTPILTHAGLNELWSLQDGLHAAVTHIGLGETTFNAHADLTELPSEINRWPILDGEQINETQWNSYAEFPYTGEPKPVAGVGFYLSSGTLLAVYSSPEGSIEAYLTPHVLLDAFYHLVLDAAPADSITIENTGVRFNPDIRELLTSLKDSKALATGLTIDCDHVATSGDTLTLTVSTVLSAFGSDNITSFKILQPDGSTKNFSNSINITVVGDNGANLKYEITPIDIHGNEYKAVTHHVYISAVTLPNFPSNLETDHAYSFLAGGLANGKTLSFTNITGITFSKTTNIVNGDEIFITIDNDFATFDVVVDSVTLKSYSLSITDSNSNGLLTGDVLKSADIDLLASAHVFDNYIILVGTDNVIAAPSPSSTDYKYAIQLAKAENGSITQLPLLNANKIGFSNIFRTSRYYLNDYRRIEEPTIAYLGNGVLFIQSSYVRQYVSNNEWVHTSKVETIIYNIETDTILVSKSYTDPAHENYNIRPSAKYIVDISVDDDYQGGYLKYYGSLEIKRFELTENYNFEVQDDGNGVLLAGFNIYNDTAIEIKDTYIRYAHYNKTNRSWSTPVPFHIGNLNLIYINDEMRSDIPASKFINKIQSAHIENDFLFILGLRNDDADGAGRNYVSSSVFKINLNGDQQESALLHPDDVNKLSSYNLLDAVNIYWFDDSVVHFKETSSVLYASSLTHPIDVKKLSVIPNAIPPVYSVATTSRRIIAYWQKTAVNGDNLIVLEELEND